MWCAGFYPALPILDESLLHRSGDVPLRYAAGILAEGLEKLYFVGLTAPRGPQIPLYAIQAEIVAHMVALNEAAENGNAGLTAYLSTRQSADDRLDMPRGEWDAQIDDTERMLVSLESPVNQRQDA